MAKFFHKKWGLPFYLSHTKICVILSRPLLPAKAAHLQHISPGLSFAGVKTPQHPGYFEHLYPVRCLRNTPKAGKRYENFYQ